MNTGIFFIRFPVRRIGRAILTVMVLAITIPTVQAGSIILENGQVISGIIQQETDRQVVVRIGGGLMRIDRERIARIERGDPVESERIMNQWRRDHFLAPAFVPPSLKNLAAEFRRLIRDREDLVATARETRRLEIREQQLIAEINGLHQELATANRRLAAADTAIDPFEYNRLVAAVNTVNAKLRDRHQETVLIRRQMSVGRERHDDYIRRHDQIVQSHRQAVADRDDQRNRIFLDAMHERLSALGDDIIEIRTTAEPHGSVATVTVRVNDRADGRLIVDTGAGLVTLSAAFAERAGIPIPNANAPTITMITADGRQVQAHPIILESLTVAGHTETKVAAAILPQPPNEDIDGLLGMSFLGRFNVVLDASKQLVLRRFTIP